MHVGPIAVCAVNGVDLNVPWICVSALSHAPASHFHRSSSPSLWSLVTSDWYVYIVCFNIFLVSFEAYVRSSVSTQHFIYFRFFFIFYFYFIAFCFACISISMQFWLSYNIIVITVPSHLVGSQHSDILILCSEFCVSTTTSSLRICLFQFLCSHSWKVFIYSLKRSKQQRHKENFTRNKIKQKKWPQKPNSE